jgi:predicted  nucleic acid-binding Zn-ribbon protein
VHGSLQGEGSMPHKCTKCGREFKDGSTEILKGCPSCGGKKFLYVREAEQHEDVLEEKDMEKIAEEKEEELLEVRTEPRRGVDLYDRIESIRVINPGSYELNIEKLAESDEVVVRLGDDERYMVDILSMVKPQKKEKKDRKEKKERKKSK